MVRRPRRANLPNTCLPYTTLFSSARRDQPRGRRARPRRGPNGGDGPLPEDRVRPAARGALLGRLQLRHHLRQAAPGAALMSEEDKRRNRDFGFETRRSEEHTSELQSLMRTSYAVFCLKQKHKTLSIHNNQYSPYAINLQNTILHPS